MAFWRFCWPTWPTVQQKTSSEGVLFGRPVMDVKKTVFLLFVAMSGSLCFWLLDILGLVKCSFTVYKVETLTIHFNGFLNLSLKQQGRCSQPSPKIGHRKCSLNIFPFGSSLTSCSSFLNSSKAVQQKDRPPRSAAQHNFDSDRAKKKIPCHMCFLGIFFLQGDRAIGRFFP